MTGADVPVTPQESGEREVSTVIECMFRLAVS
jgi:hypothetical protein